MAQLERVPAGNVALRTPEADLGAAIAWRLRSHGIDAKGRFGPPTADVVATIHGLVDATLARIDEMTNVILLAVLDAVPEYANIGAAGIEEHRRAVRMSTIMVLTVSRESRQLSQPERDKVMAIGRRRAQQRLPLDGLLAGVQVAAEIGWQFVLEEAANAQLTPVVLAAVGQLAADISACIQEILILKIEGYRAEEESRGESPAAARTQFVNDLIRRTFHSEGEIRFGASRVGMILSDVYAVAVIASRSIDCDASLLGGAAHRIAGATKGALVIDQTWTADPHFVVLLPASSYAPSSVAGGLDRSMVTIVAQPPDLQSIRHAYAQAAERTDLLRRSLDLPAVVGVSDLDVHWIMSGRATPEEADELAERVLRPVLDLGPERAGQHLRTLLAAIDLGIASAAKAEGISEVTARKRIGRIEELTGLSLACSTDRLKLGCVARLARLGVSESDTPRFRVPQLRDPS